MIRWTKKATKDSPAVENVAETHRGLVIRDFWKTDQVMSDIWEDRHYAEVWDAEQGRTVLICLEYAKPEDIGLPKVNFNDPAYWDSYYGCATVDATPEVLAAVKAAEAARWAAIEVARAAEQKARAEAEAREPRRGRWVKIVRGRKVPVGVEGECFWIGATKWGERVGIRVGEGKDEVVWTAASNVEAVV